MRADRKGLFFERNHIFHISACHAQNLSLRCAALNENEILTVLPDRRLARSRSADLYGHRDALGAA
jgi:hypothetical protein